MPRLEYVDLLHDCHLPSTSHLPRFGERGQIAARWRCPECGQRWVFAAEFLYHDRLVWRRVDGPRRRWKKAEARRLAAAEGGADDD